MPRRLADPRRWMIWFSLCLCASVVRPAVAEDWTHWRGPMQNGFSPDKNLPDSWDPRVVGKNNLIWKMPYGCRSTPLVMNGRVFICGADNEPLGVPTVAEKKMIGERVTCFDAAKGTKIWEEKFNVFHVDIVANRLGWAPLAGDAANKRVYVHTTAGFLVCFDAESGKIIWQRQLTEEFGRTTGYGGRVGGGPIFDSGLVIVGIINGSWGNMAVGTNRFYAFDGKTGEVVWIAEVLGPFRSNTYYSNPVVAVINGERLLISGGADGNINAFHVRTGKRVWAYPIATGVINPSPVVDGNLVYICHGEEISGQVGGVLCLNAGKIANGRPALDWEFKKGIRFGLSSPALAYGKLYIPDDGAKIHCFDAKKGKWLGKYNYGTVARGAPLIADGKIYVSETNFKFNIIKLKPDGNLKLTEDGDPEDEDADKSVVKFNNKPGAPGFVESNCTPSVVDGKIYIATRDEIYCIGKADWKGEKALLPPQPKEVVGDIAKGYPVITPAEVTVATGGSATFTLKWATDKGVISDKLPPFDGAGGPITWSLPTPPLPKGAMQPPPPLRGELEKTTAAVCKVMVDAKMPAQQGYVEAKVGDKVVWARVRVAPRLPYAQDFEKLPLGAVPGGLINAQGKYRVVEEKLADGTVNKVLMKVNDNPRPPVARALAYLSLPTATNYTVEADLKGVMVRGKLPDLGVCANRYILILDGKTDEKGDRLVRITTWDALPTPLPPGRVAVDAPLTWKDNTWYRVKLTVEVGDKEAVVRAKIWERGQKEPEKWTMEMTDPRPNREGAAALYGYISNAIEGDPGAQAYYDNILVKPSGKK